MFLSKSFAVNNNSSQLCRFISYRITENGEKVAVNTKTSRVDKKESWQKVWHMGREPETIRIKKIENNERLESDPRVARLTASNKMKSLYDRLKNRGFCRETKSYDPPEDVDNKMRVLCSETIANFKESTDWKNISLTDPLLKFRLLTKCAKEFDYEIPNSLLYRIVKVIDVLNFYSTPIRGISSYDDLIKNADQLPKNMHLIGEPLRYNQEYDTFFQGINAYPFAGLPVRGLHAKKKYPSIEGKFEWPDI